MDAQLPVDPRTLDAGEDAQVGGEPRGVWERGRELQQSGGQEGRMYVCAARRRDTISHGRLRPLRVFPASRPEATLSFPALAQTEQPKKTHQ